MKRHRRFNSKSVGSCGRRLTRPVARKREWKCRIRGKTARVDGPPQSLLSFRITSHLANKEFIMVREDPKSTKAKNLNLTMLTVIVEETHHELTEGGYRCQLSRRFTRLVRLFISECKASSPAPKMCLSRKSDFRVQRCMNAQG